MVEGDVLDATFVHSALEDEDAVVSCLGIRKVIQPSNIQKALLDLNNMEQVLESSELDTLAVRPVALVNGDPTGEFREWMVLQKHQNFQR